MKKSIKLLALLLVVVFAAVSFSGCTFISEIMARATVDEVFSVIQSDDIEEIKEALELGEDSDDGLATDELPDTLILALFENVEYEINSVEVIDKDNVDVNVTITNIDMSIACEDFVEKITDYAMNNIDEIESMTDEELMAKFFEILEECITAEQKTVTNETVMHVYCEDGEWDIDPTDEVIDALLGGFVTAANNLEI